MAGTSTGYTMSPEESAAAWDMIDEYWLRDQEAVQAQLIQHVRFRIKELASLDPDIRAAAGRRLADARRALGEHRPGDPMSSAC